MDLELRLHLAAEDVDVALEMDSARALQRIPAAIQEILHLRVRSKQGWCRFVHRKALHVTLAEHE